MTEPSASGASTDGAPRAAPLLDDIRASLLRAILAGVAWSIATTSAAVATSGIGDALGATYWGLIDGLAMMPAVLIERRGAGRDVGIARDLVSATAALAATALALALLSAQTRYLFAFAGTGSPGAALDEALRFANGELLRLDAWPILLALALPAAVVTLARRRRFALARQARLALAAGIVAALVHLAWARGFADAPFAWSIAVVAAAASLPFVARLADAIEARSAARRARDAERAAIG